MEKIASIEFYVLSEASAVGFTEYLKLKTKNI
jgi:hypothetical protein